MHLVLNTFGAQVLVQDGLFLIIAGDKREVIPAPKLRSITLHKGIKISSNAILLAIEHEVEVLFTGTKGDPIGRVWSHKYGSISTIRKNQLLFARSTDGLKWIVELLKEKTKNQLTLIYALGGLDNQPVRQYENRLNRALTKLEAIEIGPLQTITDLAPTLRGIEGQGAEAYFQAIGTLLPAQYKFQGRSRDPALDPFNCLINYAYGMLYGKVEIALIKAGIDPYIGVLHRDDYNRPSLVFDIIEIYRVWAEHVVVHLLMQEAVTEEYFARTTDGGYWLEGFGKRILIETFNDYLDEVITQNKVTRSRANQIEIFAQQLATMLKNRKEE